MWMGLSPLPSLHGYWPKNIIYSNELHRIMPRNRFQLLLKTWHFANNEIANETDRLYKISTRKVFPSPCSSWRNFMY